MSLVAAIPRSVGFLTLPSFLQTGTVCRNWAAHPRIWWSFVNPTQQQPTILVTSVHQVFHQPWMGLFPRYALSFSSHQPAHFQNGIMFQAAGHSLFDLAIWYIKRTFQPSLVKRKRKWGFMVRNRTKKGKKILNRRRRKGRWRLCGGI